MLGKYGGVSEGKITLGSCSYSTLVIPKSIVIDKTTDDILKDFVSQGGKVLLLDGTPREVFAKDKLLSSCGLEVPQATELVTRHFDAGADTPKTVLFEDEAADAIAEAIIKAKNNQTHER